MVGKVMVLNGVRFRWDGGEGLPAEENERKLQFIGVTVVKLRTEGEGFNE